MEKVFLESVLKQFEYYKLLGEKTFDQLSEDDLFWKYNEESNSIATIVKHLSGNMLSRWTDFLTSDGEKVWRNREEEFEEAKLTKQELLDIWQKGWTCLFETLHSLNDKDIEKIIFIRNQGHTVIEAINRQLAHYPYHIGQIVFIGKLLQNDKWNSLSISKGNSKQYNKEKFSKPQHREHFTDEIINDKLES
jgi:hypothetical protein